ncbi:hypothetical protein XENOCAPTIV_022283 [Xenoophorus captivus]|uniref:Uncharacterized protein n=1 Tax=Xenoophorus captivus TaxID=1517983 RepID=A0ABV0QB38_9TELE
MKVTTPGAEQLVLWGHRSVHSRVPNLTTNLRSFNNSYGFKATGHHTNLCRNLEWVLNERHRSRILTTGEEKRRSPILYPQMLSKASEICPTSQPEPLSEVDFSTLVLILSKSNNLYSSYSHCSQ